MSSGKGQGWKLVSMWSDVSDKDVAAADNVGVTEQREWKELLRNPGELPGKLFLIKMERRG
jgi:hypothetical protein